MDRDTEITDGVMVSIVTRFREVTEALSKMMELPAGSEPVKVSPTSPLSQELVGMVLSTLRLTGRSINPQYKATGILKRRRKTLVMRLMKFPSI